MKGIAMNLIINGKSENHIAFVKFFGDATYWEYVATKNGDARAPLNNPMQANGFRCGLRHCTALEYISTSAIEAKSNN